MKKCDDGMALCSMDLKIEEDQGAAGNDAGMTGAEFRCCIVAETFVLISEGKIKLMLHGHIHFDEVVY